MVVWVWFGRDRVLCGCVAWVCRYVENLFLLTVVKWKYFTAKKLVKLDRPAPHKPNGGIGSKARYSQSKPRLSLKKIRSFKPVQTAWIQGAILHFLTVNFWSDCGCLIHLFTLKNYFFTKFLPNPPQFLSNYFQIPSKFTLLYPFIPIIFSYLYHLFCSFFIILIKILTVKNTVCCLNPFKTILYECIPYRFKFHYSTS